MPAPTPFAIYSQETRTYMIHNLGADDAHVLIWGGVQSKIDEVEGRLRAALVAAEDKQMPSSHYHQLFG